MSAPAKEVLDLLIERSRIAHRHRFLIFIEIVVSLLRHREGAGDSDFDPLGRIGAQKRHVAHFNGMLSPDRPRNTWNRAGLAGAIKARPRIFDVDAFESGCEPVGIALPSHFAVGQDVDPGGFLIADREKRRVVLSLIQPFIADPPELLRPDSGHVFAELTAVDQPIGLGIAADERRRENCVHLVASEGTI
jgi:hypothetical protein